MAAADPAKEQNSTGSSVPANATSNLKVFIINLEHDELKRQSVLRQCQLHGLKNIELIQAVDGARLSPGQVEAAYDATGALASLGRGLSKAEIGCALSHMEVYRKIIQEGAEVCLVLEDDIEFEGDPGRVLEAILLDSQPENWEIILLGHHSLGSRERMTAHNFWGKQQSTHNHCIYRPAEIASGAYAYLINRRGADKLLREARVLNKPIDRYTGSDQHMNVYILKPPAVKIDKHLSDFYHSMAGREVLLEKRRRQRLSGKVESAWPLLYRTLRYLKMQLRSVWLVVIGLRINKHYR